MKKLLFVWLVAACGSAPAKPSQPAASAAATPAVAAPAAPAESAEAAYDAKHYARCAEAFLADAAHDKPAENLYSAACCYALDGKADQAFATLDRAVAAGWRDDAHTAVDTDFASLHTDPRWPAALEHIRAASAAWEKALGDPALRRELLALVEEDQAVRKEAVANGFDLAIQARMEAIDRKTTAKLKEVVAKEGWPGKSLVGEDGAHAAWLMIQHADLDHDFQMTCLALIEEAAKKGEVKMQNYAYLYDRIAVAEHRPQRYGTQYHGDKPAPIEDEAHVDERRKAVGLGTMAEYDKQMHRAYPNLSGPKPAATPPTH